MTNATATDLGRTDRVYSEDNYLHAGYGLRSWLLTRDHKRVAWLYLVSLTVLFVVGSISAALIRFDLLSPDGLIDASVYNRAFTVHGIVMVFFFLVPSIPTTFGNFLLPLMIGARDVAFPRINLFSWYLYTAGGIFVVITLLAGGVDTGWTFYTPYSTVYSNSAVAFAVLAVFTVGFTAPASSRSSPPRSSASPCCWCSWIDFWGLQCSIPIWAAIRCCSSTCSGSTPIPRSTS
jgi:cytochrome c oxidase subunit 1